MSNMTSIFALPTELIAVILSYVDRYEDLENFRRTCSYFKEAASHLDRNSLHIIRSRYECLLKEVGWKYEIVMLTKIISVVDASTYHFLKRNIIPPLPRAFLLDLSLALTGYTKALGFQNKWGLFQKRSEVFERFVNYLSEAVFPTTSSVDFEVLLWTVVDLLQLIKGKEETVVRTATALVFHCDLPKMYTLVCIENPDLLCSVEEAVVSLLVDAALQTPARWAEGEDQCEARFKGLRLKPCQDRWSLQSIALAVTPSCQASSLQALRRFRINSFSITFIVRKIEQVQTETCLDNPEPWIYRFGENAVTWVPTSRSVKPSVD